VRYDWEEAAALDAAGALTEDEQRELDRELAAAPPDVQAKAAAIRDTAVALAAASAGADDEPSPDVRTRLLARIEPPLPKGFAVSMEATDRWYPHPVPGIRMRVLSTNRERNYATLLLDVAPGTRFPPHHHGGAEECYVISGTVFSCGRKFGPGDFLHADADTDHGELYTDTGARVLLVVPPDDDLP
jgi:anti-sigma factor ChrR (cupin superfamily)